MRPDRSSGEQNPKFEHVCVPDGPSESTKPSSSEPTSGELENRQSPDLCHLFSLAPWLGLLSSPQQLHVPLNGRVLVDTAPMFLTFVYCNVQWARELKQGRRNSHQSMRRPHRSTRTTSQVCFAPSCRSRIPYQTGGGGVFNVMRDVRLMVIRPRH